MKINDIYCISDKRLDDFFEECKKLKETIK